MGKLILFFSHVFKYLNLILLNILESVEAVRNLWLVGDDFFRSLFRSLAVIRPRQESKMVHNPSSMNFSTYQLCTRTLTETHTAC